MKQDVGNIIYYEQNPTDVLIEFLYKHDVK